MPNYIDAPQNRLDSKDRCCGRKPIKYKRDPHFFCPRCNRAYDIKTGVGIDNWAWTWDGIKKNVLTGEPVR